jgi:putative ABC transport system permease protein
MKSAIPPAPPRWAQRFLRWYCRPQLAEDLEGDLNEIFERNTKVKSVFKAKLIYIVDVLKFLRPYTTRKPDIYYLLIQWIMIGSYVKISGRIILRNRLFSSINIVGLGVGMAVGLLLVGLLYDMRRYDRFHEHFDRIYRVVNKYQYLEREDPDFYASTSLRTAKAIKEGVAGVEKIAVLYRGFGGDIKTGDKAVSLSGMWANEDFFDVFTFELEGDPRTALKNPYSIVLTNESAAKLFGKDNAIGKSVLYPVDSGHLEFVVTGIIKNVPKSSHMQFDMLASLASREITERDNKYENAWDNMWNAYVYLLLPEKTNVDQLKSNLAALAANENKKIENTKIKLFLQPLSEIALGKDMNNSLGYVMGINEVWIFGILSVVVILSACFNYTNLSIARSTRRSKEIGVRKVSGAQKHQVVIQFVVEAVIIALAALLLSFGLFVLLKPFFLSLNDHYAKMLSLEMSTELIGYFLLLALMVGVAAGFFPALFFSRINTIRVLKNLPVTKSFRTFTMRKALIVTQFTVSLMFIAATIIGYQHYKSILSFDLGFSTENVLNIALQGNKPEALKKELLELPEVKHISSSMIITSVGNYWGTTMKYKDPLDSARVRYNSIDEHYIPLHGHKLIAGRNFTTRPANAEETEVIVNEKVLKRFDIAGQDSQKAVGETVTVNGKEMQIIGVMKDYQYGRATDKEISEVIFRYSGDKPGYLNVKVLTSDWTSTRAKIENLWKKIDEVHPLDVAFYDEQIEKAYGDYSSKIKVIGALSILAICIAAIGLFGMVVFSTETRLREISIRKVLGATERGLVYLLSKNFLLLLALAALIALPATDFFFAKYVLGDYGTNAPVPWVELVAGILIVIATASLMIAVHTLHVARSNPAKVLKSE